MTTIYDHRGEPIETKAQYSADRYLHSSINVRDGFGVKGSKPRPFDYRQAVARFRSWVYAAAMLNAQAVASVPLKLLIRRRKGVRVTKLYDSQPVSRYMKRYLAGREEAKPSQYVINKIIEYGDDFEEITEPHPITEMLRRANPYLNGFDLTTLRILQLELTGNAYLHPIIDPRTQQPGELWPMLSQWTWVIPCTDNFVKGYLYGRDPDRLDFLPDEVIHFRYPNPDDLHYGMGKVQAAWSILGLHEGKREMDTATFDNYARPDFLVVVKDGAHEDDLDRFEQHVESKLRGTRKHGRFLTLTGDVGVTPLNFAPKDLGDTEDVLEEIAGVFGVPITKLKANDPNRSNAETGDAGWMKDTILPILRMDEQTLNQTLLPLWGIEGDAVLAYDDPVPKNRDFEVNRHVQYVGAGILTINEAREEQGLEPVEGGDEPMLGGTPLSQAGQMGMGMGFPGLGGFGGGFGQQGQLPPGGGQGGDNKPPGPPKPPNPSNAQQASETKAGFDPAQSRDNQGRWSPSGSDVEAAIDRADNPVQEAEPVLDDAEARMLLRRLIEDEGFTYTPLLDSSPTEGFAVSPYPDREVVLKFADLSDDTFDDAIEQYAEANRDVLTSDPRANIGGWYDSDSDQFFLDVSIVEVQKKRPSR